MLRRGLLILLGVAGLGLLGWGEWGLQRVFREERDEAVSALHVRHAHLTEQARLALRRGFRRHLDDARPLIRAALEDETVSSDGLFHSEGPRRVLPREPGLPLPPDPPDPKAGPVLVDRWYLEPKGRSADGILVDPDAL